MTAQTLPYCELKNSDASLYKKFRVVGGSLRHPVEKMQTRNRTVTGKADTQEGSHIKRHQMTIKVRHTESVSGYGSLADLKTFFSYKNPNAVPSTQITYYENLDSDGNGVGDVHDGSGGTSKVEIAGVWDPEMVIYAESGDSAWYYVPLQLEEVV